ncbi:actin-interacting protein, variant 1 [Blastomyces gilchristii SLH14081]|uniref:Actin-interacting protein, variant 1 n=1 Tax=Blastomyces gilchristii (strain SLH14081) TaxID=559298 RepID=A0A179UGD9_BLAGS|nr:actin-interacting protein, variant 1 [Blastomyces gilchristii SLH14081]OAT06071.1 actin-interacting protein, variant 1 [Blastomyces gilchristii SLH14081]
MDSSSSSSQSRSRRIRSPAFDRARSPVVQQMLSASLSSGGGGGSGGGGASAGDAANMSQPVGTRASSGSGKSSLSRSAPDKQLSQIEKSVTHLLVATKQLLETLTQWSRQRASESEVSDVYVRLGYEFNLACRAFGAIGVDTSDLGPVPDLLRTILEDTLSQNASPESLDRYLPRIRDIIINLLQGLKKKQAKLRSRQMKDSLPRTARHGSAGSVGSGDNSLNQTMDETPSVSQLPPKRQQELSRQNNAMKSYGDTGFSRNNSSSNWSNDRHGQSFAEREASKRDPQKSAASSSSSLSSSAMQNIPVMPTYPDQSMNGPRYDNPPSFSAHDFPHPPPPTPPTSKQNDAIGMLQRSGELERRASRRFSAYQIQKHLGPSPNGVPVIPSSQNSPVPNRGRDVRESMNAVRLRGSYLHSKQRSNNRTLESALGQTTSSPDRREPVKKPQLDTSVASTEDDGPLPKTPTDKLGSPRRYESRDMPTVGGSLPALPHILERDSGSETFEGPSGKSTGQQSAPANGTQHAKTASTSSDNSPAGQFTPESSPPPSKEITLFLQYRSKIKKYVLPEGYSELTLGRLQLAFIEKFAWNTHNNGVDLPEIYLQDPVSGVRHELEDLSDVKDRSVLVLNVEPLDEVKKHFDDGVGGLRRLIEGVREIVDGQGSSIQRLTDRQSEAAKEIARLASAPPPAATSKSRVTSDGPMSGGGNHIAELQDIRRDLAVLRQTYTSFTVDISNSMGSIRSKASSVKNAANEMTVPSFEGDAGRARVNAGKKELADESERIVARVDDLQDLVEDLRKDVVTRGVRPLPRQLEAVGRDISAVTKELKKMQEFLKREKPIWTKIWEKELQLVCEERDQLTMQEDLVIDLEDDLEKATQTFGLVEQATKQQSLDSNSNTTPGPHGLRNVSRNFPIDEPLDPMKAKDYLLGEVRALQPNHENRLEAIERAEKARQKELETRRVGPLQKELGKFVEEGKLKKSGGFEEIERMRKAKEDRIRKEVWERMNGIVPESEQNVEAATSTATSPPPIDDKPPEVDNPESAKTVGPGEEHANPSSAGKRSGARGSGASDGPAPTKDEAAKSPKSSTAPASDRKRSSWLTSIFN